MNKIRFWILGYGLLGVIGLILGMNAIIPGPTSKNALFLNPSEKYAIEKGLAPKDGFLIVLSKKSRHISHEQFDEAQKDLIRTLSQVVSEKSGAKLFIDIQSSFDTVSMDSTKFVSPNGSDRVIIATGVLPVYESPKEFLDIPDILKKWNLSYPEYTYAYLSNATAEHEVFTLVNRDLDHSLVYTLPITLLILYYIFSSIRAAVIPLFIALISLIGSLGLTAIISHANEGISITASQLIVLLVLAIGVDYSLFFLTRLKEEIKNYTSFEDALRKTQKTTGKAIIWSGIIVAISLTGLLLMQDTVLNSMAFAAIISVLLTLCSCTIVLPELIRIWKDKLNLDTSASLVNKDSLLIRLSVHHPVISLVLISSILLYISSFTTQMNLGNTMIPQILPKTLQGMSLLSTLEEKFPELSGGDASIILRGNDLEERELDGTIEKALLELNAHGLKGPLKTEVSSDYSIIRYKFLLPGYGDKKETKELITNLKEKELPRLFNPLDIDASMSGVVEHSVSEAKRYTEKMPLVFSTVLGVSFIFLLFAFKSIVIPLKAIVLNLISTGASFGILVLLFQTIEYSPYQYGVIESFIPPLLFTILFGLSMDYHVFMLSRISEEFHANGDVKNAIIKGIQATSKTINGAAIIMISVFFIAATLELPVMKQLGIGLGTAILIDATVIRAILLPSSMMLLGSLNWYLPPFLKRITSVGPHLE